MDLTLSMAGLSPFLLFNTDIRHYNISLTVSSPKGPDLRDQTYNQTSSKISTIRLAHPDEKKLSLLLNITRPLPFSLLNWQ